MDALVGVISDRLSQTADPAKDLEQLAETFLGALMAPRVLRLRRLVISSAARFPEIATAWYENGFERALAALATAFGVLADRHLLAVDDPARAAEHFVGMLFWIPVNKAMFTGDDDYAATHELRPLARSAARAFMNAYGVG
jgi:TetR/AcrR family transcriptional repressor of mexJK operon